MKVKFFVNVNSDNDAFFEGPDGFIWHGYQIGDWNQIAHCKRTKQKGVQA